jgi:hypothetical protein
MRHLFVLLALLVLAAPAVAQKITVEYDRSVDFTKFKTYSWDRGVPARNPLINSMIVDGIEQSLAAKGLTRLKKDSDLKLIMAVAIEIDIQVTHGGWGNTGSSLQTGIPGSAGTAWDVRKGTLLLDMAEAGSGKLVWHGTASDTLKYEPTTDINKDAKRAEKQVKKAVEKLMKKFPPAGK